MTKKTTEWNERLKGDNKGKMPNSKEGKLLNLAYNFHHCIEKYFLIYANIKNIIDVSPCQQ